MKIFDITRPGGHARLLLRTRPLPSSPSGPSGHPSLTEDAARLLLEADVRLLAPEETGGGPGGPGLRGR